MTCFIGLVTYDCQKISSPQPKIDGGYPNHTNCIVSLLWADGKPRTPPLMVTSDSKFRDEKLTTDRRRERRFLVDTLLEKYNVDRWQIIWDKESKYYIPESGDILRKYRARIRVPSGSVIFSDMGNAFFSEGDPVIPKIFGTKTA